MASIRRHRRRPRRSPNRQSLRLPLLRRSPPLLQPSLPKLPNLRRLLLQQRSLPKLLNLLRNLRRLLLLRLSLRRLPPQRLNQLKLQNLLRNLRQLLLQRRSQLKLPNQPFLLPLPRHNPRRLPPFSLLRLLRNNNSY